MKAKCVFHFGPFRLEPTERRLLRYNQPVALTPKCFDLLVIFVENSGHLISKAELLQRLWPNQFVEESNLSFNISSLRKALGDGEDSEPFIETVPKKGFRFNAHVDLRIDDQIGVTAVGNETTEPTELSPNVVSGQSTASAPFGVRVRILVGLISASALLTIGYSVWSRRVEAPLRNTPRTIAVLPFKPLSAESRNESLEMGMAETLITKLTNVNQLVVRPMISVHKYTDLQQDPVKAGQEVQAETVLDGSIQKAGDRVRVTVRLMDVKTGTLIWSEQFDADFTDILKVQDSISERLIQALTLRLSGEKQYQLTKHDTDNPEAYQLALQGQYLFSKQTGDRADNLKKSLDYYNQALEKDPKFARAYVGISEIYISEGDPKVPGLERAAKAKAALLTALKLDSTLAEAYNGLAELKYQYEFDWSGAEADFKRAIDLNPNVSYFHLAYGWFLMCQGLFDQAQSEMDKAQELDPGSMRVNKTQGILFLFRGQYDKAIKHYQKMRELDPGAIHRNQWSMSVAYERMGMHAEAVQEFLEDGRIRGFLTPKEIELLKETFKTAGWQGYVRKRLELLKQQSKEEYLTPTVLAGIYALAGKSDLAFMWLEKAIDARDAWVSQIKIQPAYDSLRPDPRFTKLLARVNLTP